MASRTHYSGRMGQRKGRVSKMDRKQMYFKKKNRQQVDDEINTLTEECTKIVSSKIKVFEDFPLSKKTLKGLKACKYDVPTDVQRESIGLGLQGQDILGAAKTGSGKTLAFIVPVLECLFKNKWSQLDGLGALIISPTRELAYQTFEVLRKVGKFHDFSAGLVIGGKPLMEEAGRINRTNIVICTPGRLLQHMDETSYFSADSLKILVLDEADRILDMGFAQTMNGIIENLPSERQTLLFSATQTRSVKDLARLSLTEPVFVSVHEHATESTPDRLQQSYVVCELHDKLNLLWSFLKNHQKSKILVFLASCKEVKYVYEAFKKLQPGIPVLALHGGMPQLKRVAAYNQFIWKQNVVMFATDIAARGLDFPAVNWVVQLDCPEDANTYIHRVGRTARYEKDGEALLVVLPSEEEGMLEQLKAKKIPISKIKINQKRLLSIQGKLESNCAAHPELKETAQKAFVSYLRSVFLMGNKKVFNIQAIDMEQFSRSLGLAIPPKVRFLKKHLKEMEMKAEKSKAHEKSDTKIKSDSNKAGNSQSDNSDDSKSDSDVEDSINNKDKHDKVNSNKQDKIKKVKKLTQTEKAKVTGGKKLAIAEGSSDSSDSESGLEDSSDEESDFENSVGMTKEAGSESERTSEESEAESSSNESDAENSVTEKNMKGAVANKKDKYSKLTSSNESGKLKHLNKNDLKLNVHKQDERDTVMESESENSESVSDSDSSEEESDSEPSKVMANAAKEESSKTIEKAVHKKNLRDTAMESKTQPSSDESGSEIENEPGSSEVLSSGPKGAATFDVEDDNEDLFSVKRNVDLKKYDKILQSSKETEGPPVQTKKKGKKLPTKFAVAKKLLHKNMQVNTKVSFDEEGEAVIDRLKAPSVDVNTERSDKVGGIDIERAKQRMRQEDTVDREIYRQKIKQRHREERLKRRAENEQKKKTDMELISRREAEVKMVELLPLKVDGEETVLQPRQNCSGQWLEDGEEAVLANGSDDEADPLAFLPDPDEIYGEKQDSDDESYSEGPPRKKRQKKMKKGGPKKSDFDLHHVENTLADDEDLALRLLNK